MLLRAVLFDLWETLIRDHPGRNQPRRAWRTETVRSVLLKYDFEMELEPIGRALDATNLALSALHDEGKDVDAPGRADLFIDRLEAETTRRAPAAAAPALLEVIASMPPELAPHLAPGALETLTQLRSMGLATALVSNTGMTTAPNLRLLLEQHGIRDLFDVLVFSDELQLAKPHPRIFEVATQRLDIEAAACAFVGDNPLTDIRGSLAAGMFAVQIGVKTRDGVTATPRARIDELPELIPILQLHL